MTKAELYAMEAEDKDALVMSRVMRWSPESVQDPSGITNGGYPFDNWVDENGRGMYQPGEFCPTTDRNDCASVLNEIAERDEERGKDGLVDRFESLLFDLSGAGFGGFGDFDTLLVSPDLLCHCAVEVVTE